MNRRRFAIAVGAVIGAALLLNLTAVMRFPIGPLGGSDEPGESHQMATAPQAGRQDLYTTAILANGWPFPVTLEAVRPIVRDDHGGAEVLGAQPFDTDRLGEDQTLVLGSVRERPAEWAGDHPVADAQVAAGTDLGHRGTVVLIHVWAEPGWPTDVAGYEVDYRVGPFAFRAVTTTNSVILCSNHIDPAASECDSQNPASWRTRTEAGDSVPRGRQGEAGTDQRHPQSVGRPSKRPIRGS